MNKNTVKKLLEVGLVLFCGFMQASRTSYSEEKRKVTFEDIQAYVTTGQKERVDMYRRGLVNMIRFGKGAEGFSDDYVLAQVKKHSDKILSEELSVVFDFAYYLTTGRSNSLDRLGRNRLEAIQALRKWDEGYCKFGVKSAFKYAA